eukprot:113138_1
MHINQMISLLHFCLLFMVCHSKTSYEVTFEVSSLLLSDTDDDLWFKLCNKNNECGLFQPIAQGFPDIDRVYTVHYISHIDLGDISNEGSLYLLTTGDDHVCLSDIYIDGKNYDSGISPECIDAGDNIFPRAECEVLIINFASNDWTIQASNPCSFQYEYNATTTVPPMGVYSPSVAKRLCVYSMATYCSGSLGKGAAAWDCAICLEEPQMKNITIVESTKAFKNSAQGYVAYDPIYGPSIVIAFAGTNPLTIEDWITDVSFQFVNYSNGCTDCKIHKGFYDTYTSISTQIWKQVRVLLQYYGDSTKLVITGHSLGGAMAIHCAIDSVVNYKIKPSYVYTFGQPRVGDDAFAAHYGSVVTNLFRVTYRKDPVPHLPFAIWTYTHLPTEIFYIDDFEDINSGYIVCDGSGEDDECSARWSDTEAIVVPNHLQYMGYDFTVNLLSCTLDDVEGGGSNASVNIMLYVLFTLCYCFQIF